VVHPTLVTGRSRADGVRPGPSGSSARGLGTASWR